MHKLWMKSEIWQFMLVWNFQNKKYLNWVGIVDDDEKYRLYKYNINNPNSICGKIEQGIGNTYDNVLLEILDCRTDSEFYNIINKISEKEMKMNPRMREQTACADAWSAQFHRDTCKEQS